MKISWICGLIVVLAVFPVWGQEREPTDLEIAIDAANVMESRIQVTPAQGEVLHQIAKLLSDDAEKEALALWEDFVGRLLVSGAPLDIDALVQWVTRSAYIETSRDLKNLADKVRFYNDLKKSIREDIDKTKDFSRELASDEERETAEQIIDKMEDTLKTLAENSETINLALQDALNAQAQILQVMSAIFKLYHEIVTTIIMNLKPQIAGEIAGAKGLLYRLDRRLENDAETEFETALAEIERIALFRLHDLLG